METKVTKTILFLILLAVIASTLLITSKIYYWEVVDIFTLPFQEPLLLDNLDSINTYEIYIYAVYYEFIQYVNLLKAGILDSIITEFGYNIHSPFIIVFGVIFLLCACYGYVKRFNKIVYLPVLICLSASAVFMSIEVTPTEEQIGQSLSENNDHEDPDINYSDLLRSEKYDELSTRLANAQHAFDNKEISEFQYVEEFDAFDFITADDVVYLDRWLSDATNKEYAHVVRGIAYEELGWKARGFGFSNKTSETQFALMREYFSKAVIEHKAALEMNKNFLFSYVSLIRMRASYDFGMESEEIFNLAMKEFPNSTYIPQAAIVYLKPKWGGSYRQIRDVVKRMRENAVNNPLLITLSALELDYRAKTLDDYKEKDLKIMFKRFSMFYSADVQSVVNLALHYSENNDNDNMIVTLSQGLKFFPGNTRLLLHRASSFASDREIEKAKKDLVSISPDKINRVWENDVVATTYEKLGEPEKGVPYYKRSITISTKEDFPFNRLYWLAYKKVISKEEVLPYMKQWTDTHPLSSDAWIGYGDTLKTIDVKKSVYAYKKFIEYADRNNSNDVIAIKHAEEYIKDMELKK